MSERELSDPITMRLPLDVLSEIGEIAEICDRSRSWVFVRALKSYLAAEDARLSSSLRQGGTLPGWGMILTT
ncbi:hypothetical protein AMC90_PD01010 (plasmid) [Rhizobium phaseoli]|nr:hypothetical protein AMC90_PD01010 [Rhizobium phaseoli]